jgi:hypothetical protein
MPGQIRYAMMSLDQRRRLSATVQLPEVRSLKWACSRHRKGVLIVRYVRSSGYRVGCSEIGMNPLGQFLPALWDFLIPASRSQVLKSCAT